jgi:hypothetical protein
MERLVQTLTATIASLEKLKLVQTGTPVAHARLEAFRPEEPQLARLGRPVQKVKATQPEAQPLTLPVFHAKQEHFRPTMEVRPHARHAKQGHFLLKARMLARLGRPAMRENSTRLEAQPQMPPVTHAPLANINPTRAVRRQAAFPVQQLMSTAQEVRLLVRAHWPLVTRGIALWTV